MCGIAGVLYADPARPVDRAILQAMGDSIAHRGPDAEGFRIEPGFGMVHRRLSIIDLSGGDQPIGNEDDSIQVVMNGEIYNYRELREDLLRNGHRFRTNSDTETIVHLFEEEGNQLVQRLRGMFTIALWDTRSRRLLLVRDRIGIKPLYIYRDSEKLVFGSELKAILAHPDVPRSIDAAGLEDYLAFGMVPGSGSIFRGVEKLAPAHFLTASHDRLHGSPVRYWRLQLQPDPKPSADEWQEAIRAAVAESVRLHMIADVPVGAFLSGGLDSSIVVGESTKATSEPIQTFSMGFQDDSFSELPFAREVAGRFQTRHTEEIVTPDAVSLLDQMTHYFDEPFADSSAIPTFLVSRLARTRVKVALSGDGGDEAFGGYARYAHDVREAAVRRCLPTWLRRWALAPLARLWPKADWLPRPLRAKIALTNLALDAGPAYANTLSIFRQPLRRRMLPAAIASELNGHDPARQMAMHHASAPAGDALGGMIAADIATLLPDDFLVKVDRASMAHGLEVRPPLLDHKLLELTARIPSHFKLRGQETKWILKQAYLRDLPDCAVSRRKHGFEIPIDGWLRGPMRDVMESALTPNNRLSQVIDVSVARKLFRAHLARTGRHGQELWSILVLARWAERYLGTNPVPFTPNEPARSKVGGTD